MVIGVPKEIKNNEFRVGLVPAGVHLLKQEGHKAFVQEGAGEGSGILDDEYVKAGATLLPTGEDIYAQAEMIIKVKEPLQQEYKLIKEDQIIFTFLHLAPQPELCQALLESKCIAIAYETVQENDGTLKLLLPMSQVAGRIAPQVGAYYLEKIHGGNGVLLGGVPGVERGTVTIIGGGTVGANAAKIAIGLGADVHVLDIDIRRLSYLEDIFRNKIKTAMSIPENVRRLLAISDLVIGAVLIPGYLTPAIVTREIVSSMKPGSVIVDIAIDQGGCFETSKATTHEDPVFIFDGVIHYCVANIPSIVSRTSTFALTNITLPYVLEIANKGIKQAIREDQSLARGLNAYKGALTNPGVARALGRSCEDILALVG